MLSGGSHGNPVLMLIVAAVRHHGKAEKCLPLGTGEGIGSSVVAGLGALALVRGLA